MVSDGKATVTCLPTANEEPNSEIEMHNVSHTQPIQLSKLKFLKSLYICVKLSLKSLHRVSVRGFPVATK